MSPKCDFRDVRDCHFGWDLNGENAYFVVIPKAIIDEVAFYKSITAKLCGP